MARCLVCRKEAEDVRVFKILIDDEPLAQQPALCRLHGETYLFRIGAVLGEMMRDVHGAAGPTLLEEVSDDDHR